MKLIGYIIVMILILVLIIPVFIIKGCEIGNSQSEQKQVPEEEKIEITVRNHTNNEVMDLDLEEYIVGVIAAEMPVTFDIEALKAQAIAARTYTLRRLEQFGATPDPDHPQQDICTNPAHCQAWINKKDRIQAWKNDKKYSDLDFDQSWEKLQEAVYSTQGQVAIYNGQLIDPLFHSTSGGKTENSEDYFTAQVPYLRSVVSQYEKDSPHLINKTTMGVDEFLNKLKAKLPDIQINKKNIKNEIQIVETTEGGQIGKIRIGDKTLTGREAREILGLKSSDFDIEIRENKIHFTVIGFGHGVGMSQYGADGMAKEGSDYKQIIEHYYQGVQIVDVHDL